LRFWFEWPPGELGHSGYRPKIGTRFFATWAKTSMARYSAIDFRKALAEVRPILLDM